jgi:hypothetical protein
VQLANIIGTFLKEEKNAIKAQNIGNQLDFYQKNA